MDTSYSPLENHSKLVELSCDVILIILKKLEVSVILKSAQFVCKLWYNLCKEPSIWRTLRIHDIDLPEMVFDDEIKRHSKTKMFFNAVERCRDDLIDLDIRGFCPPDLFSYAISRSSQLKRLRLACCRDISLNAIIETLGKLSCLEELEIALCYFAKEEIVRIIDSCPSLTTFRLNKWRSRYTYQICNAEAFAFAIARNMPELRHLQLIGNNISCDGLTRILDGCPLLQSFDLRQCYLLGISKNLQKRLRENLKDFHRPNDSIPDYDLCYLESFMRMQHRIISSISKC